MRYTYKGDRLTPDPLRDMQCDPVRRADGKCIVSVKMATALVIDKTGRRHVVARRRLRVNEKARGKSMEYEDMSLVDFANLARESSAELGAIDNNLLDYETGESWKSIDPKTAVFLASARNIVLELIRRNEDVIRSADDLIDEQTARIAELEAMVGLAIKHIDGKGEIFSERGAVPVLHQLRQAVPDADQKYESWLAVHRSRFFPSGGDPASPEGD